MVGDSMNFYLQIVSFFLLLWDSHGWNFARLNAKQNQQTKNQFSATRGSLLNIVAAAMFSSSTLFLDTTCHPLPAHAASPPTGMEMRQQSQQSLKPATPSQPQIMLRGSSSESLPNNIQQQSSIVEGLIYFANPNSNRPVATDSVVITIRSVSRPDDILGGARVPVLEARFPLAFRMFPQNIFQDKQKEWSQAKDEDLLVKALICPEDIPKCQEYESRMQAEGVAKLIRNLPGQGEIPIRAPASLSLK